MQIKTLTFRAVILGLLTIAGASSLFAQQAGYSQTNLVANTAGVANHTDAQLSNPWGISFIPGQPFWIANNNGGTSTVYDGVAGGVRDLSNEVALRVVGVHGSIAEIADQHVAGEGAKGRRGHHHTPGSIQRSSRGKSAREVAFSVECVDDSQPCADHRIVLGGILHGISNQNDIRDDLDSVRSITGRKVGIGEIAGKMCRAEVVVEHIDFAAVKVGSEKERTLVVVQEGEPLVDSAGRGVIDYGDSVALPRPIGEDAVLGIK